MPVQKGKSALSKYQGQMKKAHESHKGDKTEFSAGGNLPGGIEGGVAVLVKCEIGKYKKGENEGEPFFMAQGVVVEPKEFQGRKIQGKRTMIMEPLCDTPKSKSRSTFEDHWAWMLNEARKLGVDTENTESEDIEATLNSLVEEGSDPLYFGFRTWQGAATKEYPNPRVNHDWEGVTEYTPTEDTEDDEDSSEEVETETKSSKSPPSKKPPVKTTKGTKQEEPEETEAEDEESSEGETPDIDGLVEVASGEEGDEATESQATLTKMAEEAGVDPKKVKKAESWESVGEMIKEASPEEEESSEEETSEEETEETEEEEEKAPEVEDMFKYFPIDPVTKKPMVDKKTKKPIKAIDVEVKSVDTKAKTVTLLNYEDKKTVYKNVKWDKLIRE